MRTLLAVMAVALLLAIPSCSSMSEIQNPRQARDQARALRSEAAALQRDARDYAALMKMTESALEKCRIQLDAALKQDKEAGERVLSLRADRATASEKEGQFMDRAIEVYEHKKQAAEARVEDAKVRLRTVQGQLDEQRELREAALWRAEQREKEAARLEEYAIQLSRK